MAFRSVYRGQKRKLVLAFDVGTTFSGISYRFVDGRHTGASSDIFDNSILDPGQVPEIKPVTRFVLENLFRTAFIQSW